MSRQESDSYRPRYDADSGPPPPLPADAQDAMYHFQGNGYQSGIRRGARQHNAPSRSPRPFKFRVPPPASARPLMTHGYLQESSEGLTFGGEGAEDKFRNLDELTDTDETDMDLSADEDETQIDNDEDRPSKRSRINERGDAADVPKWSNPDPYTALPPVDQDSRKKLNVVNLIRKARNLSTATKKDDSAPDDDFISFDVNAEDEAQASTAPPDAPSGPRLGRHEVVASLLGKRTRDEFEQPPVVITKHGQQHYSDGRVLDWWRAGADCEQTPWLKNGFTSADSAGVALHKEIIDFYEWVRPKDYEIEVRNNLVRRLEQALLRIRPGGKLHAFGSYAAGLYLPVGDMDLVFLERNFRPPTIPNGVPEKPPRKFFHTIERFIKDQGIARPGSVNPIWFAKVPIIKFVDNVTGLKVDLSFNNSTGVTANETFHKWQEEHPAMPIITSIIKQFLMIRGLNDVAIGGLGGFSVICLVTSLIQHMPLTSQPANLGQLLVEFFNLYGNLFNRQAVAIRLDPPGYVDVNAYRPFDYNNDKPDRLKIIDPNRPDNNISGGTGKIGLIFRCFSKAHDDLQARLMQHDGGHPVPSFLESLIGGNFNSYDIQRDFLRTLHYGPVGQRAPAVIPPPPPPIASRRPSGQLPPPPPPIHQSQVPVRTRSTASSNDSILAATPNARNAPTKVASSGSRNKKNEIITTSILKQFTRFRPELTARSKGAQTMQELAQIGGYGHVNVMLADLAKREGLVKKSNEEVTLDLHRGRARRFCPDLSDKINDCTSIQDLAELCGYDGEQRFFATLSRWEKENDVQELKAQEKVALRAAAAEKIQGLPQSKRPKKKKKKNKSKV